MIRLSHHTTRLGRARLRVMLLLLIAGVLLVAYATTRLHQTAGSTRHALIVGQDPDAIALAPAWHRLFVLNYGDGTISMVDTRHPSTARTLAIGGTPYPSSYGLIVALRAGRVFVVNGGNAVRMLDTASGRLLRTISLPVAPFFLAVDEHTNRVFVSESNSFTGTTVSVLDAGTGRVIRRVVAGHGVSALAVDERAGHVFVQNVGVNAVSMLDARSGVLLRTIPLGPGPSILARSHTRGGPLPTAVVVDERTSRAFVTGFGAIYVLDARTGKLLRTTAVGGNPDVAVDARTNRVFVANLREGTVSILDARTGHALRRVSVGNSPWSLAVVPSQGRVCVVNAGSNTVSVLDARSGRVLRTVPVGYSPRAMAVDDHTGRVYVTNLLAQQGPRHVFVRGGEVQQEWQRVMQWFSSVVHPAPSGPIPGSVSVISVAR